MIHGLSLKFAAWHSNEGQLNCTSAYSVIHATLLKTNSRTKNSTMRRFVELEAAPYHRLVATGASCVFSCIT
jgi:hypothetical protein